LGGFLADRIVNYNHHLEKIIKNGRERKERMAMQLIIDAGLESSLAQVAEIH
jgi:hypothetical protein